MLHGAYAGDITPQEAWDLLARDARAHLIDVRTQAEWAYVGIPDISSLGKQPLFVPWQLFPTMQMNPEFAHQVASSGVESDAPLIFICRSGQRSRLAAITMTAHGFTTCYNVGTGFEGTHDPARHRGTVSGWKVDQLPWVQG